MKLISKYLLGDSISKVNININPWQLTPDQIAFAKEYKEHQQKLKTEKEQLRKKARQESDQKLRDDLSSKNGFWTMLGTSLLRSGDPLTSGSPSIIADDANRLEEVGLEDEANKLRGLSTIIGLFGLGSYTLPGLFGTATNVALNGSKTALGAASKMMLPSTWTTAAGLSKGIGTAADAAMFSGMAINSGKKLTNSSNWKPEGRYNNNNWGGWQGGANLLLDATMLGPTFGAIKDTPMVLRGLNSIKRIHNSRNKIDIPYTLTMDDKEATLEQLQTLYNKALKQLNILEKKAKTINDNVYLERIKKKQEDLTNQIRQILDHVDNFGFREYHVPDLFHSLKSIVSYPNDKDILSNVSLTPHLKFGDYNYPLKINHNITTSAGNIEGVESGEIYFPRNFIYQGVTPFSYLMSRPKSPSNILASNAFKHTTNDSKLLHSIRNYITNIENRINNNGVVVGSTRMLSRDGNLLSGVPGDTEILTTQNRLNDIIQKLGFTQTNVTANGTGIKGTSPFAINNELDINILPTIPGTSYVTGTQAIQIMKHYYPELMREYLEFIGRNDFHPKFVEKNTGKIYIVPRLGTIPIPRMVNGKFDFNSPPMTDEEFFNFINAHKTTSNFLLLDMFSSMKNKHAIRSANILFSDDPQHISISKDIIGRMGKLLDKNYKQIKELYPNIDLNNVDSNKKFLTEWGYPEEYAYNPEIMENVLNKFLLEQEYAFRTVNRYPDLVSKDQLADQIWTNIHYGGGDYSGPGGNMTLHTSGGLDISGIMTGSVRIPLTYHPDNVSSASDFLQLMNRRTEDITDLNLINETLAKYKINPISKLRENGGLQWTTAIVNSIYNSPATEGLPRNELYLLANKIIDQISRQIDRPSMVTPGYKHLYLGSFGYGKPSSVVPEGVRFEVGNNFRGNEPISTMPEQEYHLPELDNVLHELLQNREYSISEFLKIVKQAGLNGKGIQFDKDKQILVIDKFAFLKGNSFLKKLVEEEESLLQLYRNLEFAGRKKLSHENNIHIANQKQRINALEKKIQDFNNLLNDYKEVIESHSNKDFTTLSVKEISDIANKVHKMNQLHEDIKSYLKVFGLGAGMVGTMIGVPFLFSNPQNSQILIYIEPNDNYNSRRKKSINRIRRIIKTKKASS